MSTVFPGSSPSRLPYVKKHTPIRSVPNKQTKETTRDSPVSENSELEQNCSISDSLNEGSLY